MKNLTKQTLWGAALATLMALPAIAQESVSAVVIAAIRRARFG